MGPRLVPLLVKPATTLSPPRLNSRISRCMSAKAPVELAWVNALEASLPSKVPRLPPCQTIRRT